ncbi:MAG TPA: hypothetical protein VHY48_02335 [Acidobacteriaceae bacterium]|nr:hypothetical protein [Acidobacteriaceae bacterium]
MKKLIALLVLAAIVYLVWNRERVFVRDPLASVMRNGSKVGGEQIYINFSNDVLLENDNPPMHVLLVESGQPVGVPTRLHCIHWLACMTDAKPASILPTGGTVLKMTNRAVSFRDEDARDWTVILR